MNLILTAAVFATRCHSGQRRKYTEEPYIRHPGRVAARLMEYDDVTEDEVAAAWLHDVIEDCGETSTSVALVANLDVATLVLELTNTSKVDHPNANRVERKQRDRQRLSTVSDKAKRIKLLDRIDNVRGMSGAPADFRELYFSETRMLLGVLDDAPYPSLVEELKVLVMP